MRWQTTIVLTIALLLVGGFYYVYEMRWAPERERVETRKGRIFQAEPADVTAVELKRREDTVRFARAGEGWELKAPVVARGDRARIDETLTTVLTAKVDREIDPKPAAPGAFGLDKPAAEVTLTLKDGKTVGVAIFAIPRSSRWTVKPSRDSTSPRTGRRSLSPTPPTRGASRSRWPCPRTPRPLATCSRS